VSTLPPAITALVEEDSVPLSFTAATVSPKSVALPVVAISKNSITLLVDGVEPDLCITLVGEEAA